MRRIRPVFLAQFDDETLLQHAFDGAIEGAGAEAHFASSSFGDVLHDGVTVLVAIRERDQDVEDLWRQRRMLHDLDYTAMRYSVKRYSGCAVCWPHGRRAVG